MRRIITLILFCFLFSVLMPSFLPTVPGIGSLAWADQKDDLLKKKLKDHRYRLLTTLKDVPGGQWYGKANACEVWKAMDQSQRYVFMIHTDLLGQRSLLYNYPIHFYRIDYQGAWQSCYPSEECTESNCVWVDDMGNCRSGSGWDCYYANRCTIERGTPTDYTMAIEYVNRLLWVAGSCPWPTKWNGWYCTDNSGNYKGETQCGGENNNRIFYEAADTLIQKFRNFAQGLPMWDKSEDPGGPHKGYTNTSETVHRGGAAGQVHFFSWDTDPNKWVEGRTLWSRFCNERGIGATCNNSVYATGDWAWAPRMVEQDYDVPYSFPLSFHPSSPVCRYSSWPLASGNLGYDIYNSVWTNQVTANNAAYDYDPCVCTPTTSCAAQGKTCGQIWNGCANETCGSYNGGCASGQTCSNNVCVCSPTTSCAVQGKTCGQIWNGCANETCGSYGGGCPSGQSCSNNVCQSSSGGGAYYCYSGTYPWYYYGFQTWLCNAAYRPIACYTANWQLTACPGSGGGSTSVCGNGTCEAGENGSNCPQDCCDQYTPCGQTRQNDGVHYCRNMYYYDWQSGQAYWHGWQWVTQNDTTQMCSQPYQAQEGAWYQTQYQCGGTAGKCHSVPGGYY
jgi:hypothetical protein